MHLESKSSAQQRHITNNATRYFTSKGYASIFTGVASSDVTVASTSLPIPPNISHKVCTPSDAVI